MRRIIEVFAVAVLMAAMMVLFVTPAIADIDLGGGGISIEGDGSGGGQHVKPHHHRRHHH